jgi:hypothetical protein
MAHTLAELIEPHTRALLEWADETGTAPENIKEIVYRPFDVTVTVYVLNEHGKKHIGSDGTVAISTIVLPAPVFS